MVHYEEEPFATKEDGMGRKGITLVVVMLGLLLLAAAPAWGADVLVTSGSPAEPFPRNKQNEPAIAVNPLDPTIQVAGANEEIDVAPAVGNSAPFTPGVGNSGIYFSFDSGATWQQPEYTGWSARTNPPQVGPIGTIPWYLESGLVSDGDPVLAFGPAPGAGGFSWANGARLYYANLASNFATVRSDFAFKGYEAIAVSRVDLPTERREAPTKDEWFAPVVVSSRTSSTTFSDKEQLWADNAATSPYFGNVYVGWVTFRSNGSGPEPVLFSRSPDGGATWSAPRQLSPAANSGSVGGRQGVIIRTDSKGRVYVFWEGVDPRTGRGSVQLMTRSTDGGRSFEKPNVIAPVVDVGVYDPASGDTTFDGVLGARTNSFPSVDIANAAPSGSGATDLIALCWSDARNGRDYEQALVSLSSDRGSTWSAPVNAAEGTDRPDFPAVALSPDGADVYVTYDAFLQPWQSTLSAPRMMQGVVLHADVSAGGTAGAFATLHRGVPGDARASSTNSLVAEFLGDYNWIVATNDGASAVWNDCRDAAVDDDILAYRGSLMTTTPLPKPAVDLTLAFGNTDIYGITVTEPTP